MMFMFTGCAGTYYSHKKIPVKIKNIDAKMYGELQGLDLAIDIERCYSGSDECSKILDAIHNGNGNIEGVNWDNYEIIIKEIK